MTDGAPYFPEVVKNVCPDAFHQICLVHVMRGLYPYLQAYKTKFHEDLRAAQSAKQALLSNKRKKKEKCYTLKKLGQQLTYWKQKRSKFREKHDLKPYQKGIWDQYPELKKINEKLNLIRAQIRSLTHTIENLREKEPRLKAQIESTCEQKNKSWGKYMVKCRLLHRFYRLFNLKGEPYELERLKLLSHLRENSEENCELIQEISRLLLKANNLDTVNKAECPIQLNFHYINTNSIENLNSQIRPYLECLRNITNSDYLKTYFGLLRLYLNTRRPFSGVRRDTSPLERYGYDLRGKNYLDLLQDGLPTGPQYGILCSKIKLSRAAPNMVNNCIL
jgi:transposase-like protein